jgi:DNA-binding response OmpR family regulator
MLARTLDYAGFRVLQAGDGDQALAVVRRLTSRLGLVVTDINMPVMNGFELARAIQPLYPSLPILFITGGLPQSSNGVSLREVGEHLLLKPFGPDVFVEAVSNMVALGPRARRAPA